MVTWLSVGVLLSMAVWGCADPQQRYRTLSFFFDGVPPPSSINGIGAGLDADAMSPEARTVAQAVSFRYHAPYAQHDCSGCHDIQRGYELADAPDESCRQCHESHFVLEAGDWMHGPVAMNECSYCHEPHRSVHDNLLTVSQPELCLTCHEPEWFAADPFHGQLEDNRCSSCHDPHAAGNPLLLVDSRTIERRQRVRRTIRSTHPAFRSDECATCHVQEQANVLIGNVDQACVSCHEDVLHTDVAPLHQAVSDRECTTCHTAHQSSRPDLIRPMAEALCFSCHAREEVQTPQHPRVTRVDCLSCHTGHRVLRPGMLRDGVGVAPGQASQPEGGDSAAVSAPDKGGRS